MSEFIDKINYLIERDGLNARNRKREIIYRKCYLQSKLRELGMNFRQIGEMFNQHHASVIHNIKTHKIMSELYADIYSTEISDYVAELTGLKFEPPKRNLVEDIMYCNKLYDLRIIKRRIKENYYDDCKTIIE